MACLRLPQHPTAAATRHLQPFPGDYNQAVRQAQGAAAAALADGASLVEVEFPTASLVAVAGDAEGETRAWLAAWLAGWAGYLAGGAGLGGVPAARCQAGGPCFAPRLVLPRRLARPAAGANEMTYSLQHLRQFMRGWKDQAGTTRIFFPDPTVRPNAWAGPERGTAAVACQPARSAPPRRSLSLPLPLSLPPGPRSSKWRSREKPWTPTPALGP